MGFNILKLKELVKRKKLQHKELGTLLGVSDRTVLNYLTERTKIDVETIYKFSQILEVPVGYFFDQTDNSIIKGDYNNIGSGNNMTIYQANSQLKDDLIQCQKELIKAKERIELLSK